MNLLDKLLSKQDELAEDIVKIHEGIKPKEPDIEEKEPDQKLIKTLTEEGFSSTHRRRIEGLANQKGLQEIEDGVRLVALDLLHDGYDPQDIVRFLTNQVAKAVSGASDAPAGRFPRESIEKIVRKIVNEGVKPKEPDIEEKEPDQKLIKTLTEQPEDFRDVRDDEEVVDDEDFRDERPGDRDVEPEAAVEESPFPEKEYFGQDTEKELHYYLIGIKSDDDTREDVQIQDQEENLLWSAKEKGIDISDVAMTIVEIVKELEVDVNYDVFMKYVLPKLVEEEEEETFEEEDNFGEEDEFGREKEGTEGEPFESITAKLDRRTGQIFFEKVLYITEKQAPTCSKCNKAHWPFQKCNASTDDKTSDGKEVAKESSIMKTNVIFNEQKFDITGNSIDTAVTINGKKFPLSEDTLKFYHLKETEDLKCLANDMLRAMNPDEIKALTEDNSDKIKEENKESIMETDKIKEKEKNEKKVNEDLSSDVKELQNQAMTALKDSDYIKAAELVQRLSSVESAVGTVSGDDKPVEEPELEAEVDVEVDTEETMEEKAEENNEEKEAVEEGADETVAKLLRDAEAAEQKAAKMRKQMANQYRAVQTGRKGVSEEKWNEWLANAKKYEALANELRSKLHAMIKSPPKQESKLKEGEIETYSEEAVDEEKIEEMTIQEAEEYLKSNGLNRNDDTTDEQVIEAAKSLKSVLGTLEEKEDTEKDEKVEEKEEKVEEKEVEENNGVTVGVEEKKIMGDIFESTRLIKEDKEEKIVEEDR